MRFSLGKIKDDNSAILFYTGFPCYEALTSFFKYLEPKLGKMQYWKGEHLVLMRLKAGLFVQDLADRFGASTSVVSRICITWINLLYLELKDLFHHKSWYAKTCLMSLPSLQQLE